MTEYQYLDDGNSEAQDRLATSFLLAQTSAGLATTGVLSGLAVTQTSTASGSVLIAVGAAPVQASVTTGVALLVNDTIRTLDVFTANPVGGLPRWDIVVFDLVTKALTPIVGTPNASPSDPTVPATACALARLRHGAGATTIPAANIDDLRTSTFLSGVRAPAVSTKRTTTAGPFTTGDNALVSAPSVTGDGVKRFRISGSFYALNGSVAGDVFEAKLKDSSTAITLSTCRVTIPATPFYANGMTLTTSGVPAAGSHVYQIVVTRVSGTGTGGVTAISSAPIEIIVEQIA